MGKPIKPGDPGGPSKKYGNVAVCREDLMGAVIAPDKKSVTACH